MRHGGEGFGPLNHMRHGGEGFGPLNRIWPRDPSDDLRETP